MEDDTDESMLRASVPIEFEKKSIAESEWPQQTACDRLDEAFDAVQAEGIITIQDAGLTISDGLDDVAEILDEIGRDQTCGYCFYQGRDLDRALQGDGLMLALGDLDDTPSGKIKIGQLVVQILRQHWFDVDWEDDPENAFSSSHSCGNEGFQHNARSNLGVQAVPLAIQIGLRYLGGGIAK